MDKALIEEMERERLRLQLPRRLSNTSGELVVARLQITAMVEALEACEEYFDNKADADHDETGFVPNREMVLLKMVRDALRLAGK